MAAGIIMKPQLRSQYLNVAFPSGGGMFSFDGVFPSHVFHQLHEATTHEEEISSGKGSSKVLGSSFPALPPGGVRFRKKHLGSSIPTGV